MHLSPEWAEYAKATPLPDLQVPTTATEAQAIRGFMAQFEDQIMATADNTGLSVRVVSIPTRDSHKLRALVYTPDGPGQYPVVLYMHGGGWVLGRPETDDKSVRGVCRKAKVLVVSLDYRLAPENPWPTPVNDCVDGLKWVFENAPSIRGDVSRGVIVSGFSAGGHLAATLALRALKRKVLIPIRGVVLRAPMLSDWRALSASEASALKSLEENAHAPVINTDSLKQMIAIYNVPGDRLRDPEEFPLHLSVEAAKGFPPTFIQVSQADPLRDEGLLFNQTLKNASVDTRLHYYEGMPHGFHMHNIPTATKAEEDLADGFEWILDFGKPAC
ncbi:hypothetical protein CLAIMM_00131 [Cladophialophora immunda]|nr:hypothetical protein CLAIMM_00131 [Cladophialophora immunda]